MPLKEEEIKVKSELAETVIAQKLPQTNNFSGAQQEAAENKKMSLKEETHKVKNETVRYCLKTISQERGHKQTWH